MMWTQPVAASRGKLLILGSEFPPGPGGIGTHAYQLAHQLSHLGWAVQVLTPQAYVTAAEREAFNSRQTFAITALPERDSGGWWRQRLSVINETVKTWQPDLIVASGRRALWMAAAVARRHDLPWVAVGHGSEFVGQAMPARFLTAQSIARATAVVAVSRYTADLVGQAARPARLEIIPNGADGDRFHPRTVDRDRFGGLLAGNRRVLLTVGHVSERKAQDIVVRALPQIIAQYPDVVYVMVGLPSRQAELEQLAEALGVGEHVVFAGVLPDDQLIDYYNLADLFVLVSRATGADVEGYGIVVKEAALCGTPAVVSQGCGLTEAIEEGVTGLSVPPEDPAATAAAVNLLLGDDARRHAMGRAAREQARQDTWAARAVAYDALLQDLMPVGA